MADSESHRVAILTAIQVEYQAVRAYLSKVRAEVHPLGTRYERGTFYTEHQPIDVLIMETGAGNERAAMEAIRAIDYFRPSLILFVGVAGGLKDVKLGDVVAATKVYGYESGKADKIFHARPEIGNSTYFMEQLAKYEARQENWLNRLNEQVSPPFPRVFVAPIAAGSRVVASTRSATWKFLKATYSDALAVEMEGYGFLQAAHASHNVDALIIRGISDLIEGKSDADANNYQEIAARNASAFAFELLAKLDNSEVQNREQVIEILLPHDEQITQNKVNDSGTLNRVNNVLGCRIYLQSLRRKLLYEMNLQEIKEGDIKLWEKELRSIVASVDAFRNVYGIEDFTKRIDELQLLVWDIIINLYLALDILQGISSTRDRQVYYQKLKECPPLLSKAMQYLELMM